MGLQYINQAKLNVNLIGKILKLFYFINISISLGKNCICVVRAAPCTFLIHFRLLRLLRFDNCSFKLKRILKITLNPAIWSNGHLRWRDSSSPYISPGPSDQRFWYKRFDPCNPASNRHHAKYPDVRKNMIFFIFFKVGWKNTNNWRCETKPTFSFLSEKTDVFTVFQQVMWNSTLHFWQQHNRIKPCTKRVPVLSNVTAL